MEHLFIKVSCFLYNFIDFFDPILGFYIFKILHGAQTNHPNDDIWSMLFNIKRRHSYIPE